MMGRKEATRRIEQILRERGSSIAEDVAKVDDVRQIPRPIREKIVDELGDEFSGKGLGPDSEPNAYGIEIENLTDACGLAWDKEGLH
jgi:hypothetical protein